MKNTDTEKLIAELAQSSGKKSKAFNPLVLFIKWIIFSVIYIILLANFLHLRPDLSAALQDTKFFAELVILLAIIILSSYSCIYLAIPDAGQKRAVFILPLIPLAALMIYTIFLMLDSKGYHATPGNEGIMCTTCITLSSFIPAILLFLQIKKAAPTRLGLVGFYCLIYAASLGAFALRLEEQVDSYEHLIIWHYGPIFALAAFGALISKKILKW
jgi:hypothetical protein